MACSSRGRLWQCLRPLLLTLLAACATTPAEVPQHAQHEPPPPQQPWMFPTWWNAPFWSGTGYGDEARTFVAALVRSGSFQLHDLYITHSGDAQRPGVVRSIAPEMRSLLRGREHARLAGGRLSDADMARPAIVVCHSFPTCWGFVNGAGGAMDSPGCPCPPPEAAGSVAYRIGRTMFETDGLPTALVERCNQMDEVWVPTEFNRGTFERAGVDARKLRVLGESVDTDRFSPDKGRRLVLRALAAEGGAEQAVGPRSRASLAAQPFVFLSIFKWEARKGWPLLLDAYSQEFGEGEGTELHIFTQGMNEGGIEDYGDRVRRHLQRSRGPGKPPPPSLESLPHVFVHWRHVNDSLYPSLYASADAVVLPTRGEGWGRPQMEAMAMGRPVITTNWSGPTAFTNDDVAYLIPVADLSDATADMAATNTTDEMFKGQRWADPSLADLRRLMRRVHTRREEAEAKGVAARAHVVRHFTPAVVSRQIEAELRRVEALLAQRGVKPGARPPHATSRVGTALCATASAWCVPGAGVQRMMEAVE